MSSYNYNFDVYNVYSSFNNAEISEHRWYWDSANKFGVEIEKNKGRADDGLDNWNDNFKISYLGPVSKTLQKVFFYKTYIYHICSFININIYIFTDSAVYKLVYT